MNTKNYSAIARAVIAYGNCINHKNTEWETRWERQLAAIIDKDFPHGSGFDCGTKFDIDENLRFNGQKLVFTTAFHHMNEGGMYDGWTEHTITVKPDLAMGYSITISGKNRNQIKEYIHECFSTALDADCTIQA